MIILQPTTCDLSHRKNDVWTFSAALLKLCNRGGMKSSKMSQGRNASQKVGNHCLNQLSRAVIGWNPLSARTRLHFVNMPPGRSIPHLRRHAVQALLHVVANNVLSLLMFASLALIRTLLLATVAVATVQRTHRRGKSARLRLQNVFFLFFHYSSTVFRFA